MKKIIYLCSFLVLFCISSVVHAYSFYEGEYLPGEYIKKEKNGIVKYKQTRFIKVNGSNKEAYCIEPFTKLDTNEDYSDFEEISYLSNYDLQRLSLLAYYGYNYQDYNINHLDKKWYAITQVMIQRAADKESDIYFTDKLNGSRISKYEQEINEINTLVNNHFIKPSFDNQTFKILKGDTIEINDNNNVLNKYNISSNNSKFNVEKNDNKIKITANEIGNENINLQKNDNNQNMPLIYKSLNSQNILTSGKMINVFSNFYLESFTGTITVNKFDNDYKSCQAQGDAKLEGSIYNLYDESMRLLKEITIDSNCQAKVDNLSAGTYYLKEKSPGLGYELDDNTYKVILSTENPNQEITLYDKVIKTNIEVDKKYGNMEKGDFNQEDNAKFSIYNSQNKVIGEIITNNEGHGNITLPFGKYIIRQIDGKKNYYKINDINLDINEKLGNNIKYNLYNFEKTFKLKLLKLDRQTNKLIKNNQATFIILNKNTNNFLLNKDNYIYFKTDNSGILNVDNLSIGDYIIYEFKSPNGYYQNKAGIEFSVTEEDIDKNNGNYVLELDYFNDKKLVAPNTNIDTPKNNLLIFINLFIISFMIVILKKVKI